MTTAGRRSHPRRPPHGRRGVSAGRVILGTARILGRLLRGVIALAGLVALVGGLPWALWHYIGWPLPHQIPTWDQVQALLLNPMSTQFLLDFLGCVCWIAWAAFVLDVIGCTVAAVRGARWPDLHPSGGPVHALAAVLVGAVVLSLLGNRPASPMSLGVTDAAGGHGATVATAAAWIPAPTQTPAAALADYTTPGPLVSVEVAGDQTPQPTTVVVRAPANGVYDSLYRIAERTLGMGQRWPEIFQLNVGKPQADGRALTTPSLIRPGWVFDLPQPAPNPPSPPSAAGNNSSVSPPPARTSTRTRTRTRTRNGDTATHDGATYDDLGAGPLVRPAGTVHAETDQPRTPCG